MIHFVVFSACHPCNLLDIQNFTFDFISNAIISSTDPPPSSASASTSIAATSATTAARTSSDNNTEQDDAADSSTVELDEAEMLAVSRGSDTASVAQELSEVAIE